MKLPQIRIQSQMAQIQIQKTDAQQKISQPKAELTIQQPKAVVNIETTPGKLTIDQTQAWEDMNLMHISKRIKKYADDGKAAVLQGIARRAQQGNELMRIENDGNPLMSQAVQNGHDQQKSLGITFIPSHFSVKTDYQPADVNINVQVNKPIIEATPRKPQFEYQPGKVETSLKQREQLDIRFTNLLV